MLAKKVIKHLLSRSVIDKMHSLKNQAFIGKILHICYLSWKAKAGDGSFAGEYEVLDELATKLNIKNGFVIDVAASDGYSQSCTLGFFRRKGWSGLAVEMDPDKFAKLSFIYSSFRNAKLARNRVTPNNIKSLLESYEVPKDISILNLDIDSYDLYVIEKMLQEDYKPKIISMEINEKIPPGIFFTVDYDDDHYWQADHFYGCSIEAACSVVKPFGYILHKMEWNNAIFVRDDSLCDDFIDLTAEDAYNSGYLNKTNRKDKFYFNSDVEHWLHLDSSDAINEIRLYFGKYKGQFTLRQI